MRTPLVWAVTALVMLVGTLVQAQPGAPRRLLPVDEAASQPDFFSFRAQLLVAVVRRDLKALMAVVHPNIKCDFGGGEGKAYFEAHWKPSTAGSQVWTELAEVLALGGTFTSTDSFVAPYVFTRWPDLVDAFGHVAIVGKGVRIRSAPRADAEPVAIGSFEILPLAPRPDDTTEGWTAIRLPAGKVGYVWSRYVRSPIGYRAAFSRQAGRWQMVMFLAGD